MRPYHEMRGNTLCNFVSCKLYGNNTSSLKIGSNIDVRNRIQHWTSCRFGPTWNGIKIYDTKLLHEIPCIYNLIQQVTVARFIQYELSIVMWISAWIRLTPNLWLVSQRSYTVHNCRVPLRVWSPTGASILLFSNLPSVQIPFWPPPSQDFSPKAPSLFSDSDRYFWCIPRF